MAERKDWIYARLLKKGTFIFPRKPYWFGWVEFVPLDHLDGALWNALSQSTSAHGISAIQPSDSHHVVIRTIVMEAGADEVEKEAIARLREAVGIFSDKAAPLRSEFEILNAGATLDIVADSWSPLLPPLKGQSFTGAVMDDRAVHPTYVLNLLLAAPNGFGELGLAYARSQHWKLLAGAVATTAEKVLLHWMAVEALCSARAGDNPIPNLMYASGFPIGRRSAAAASLARTVPRHSLWRRKLLKLMEATRSTRNGIVHEGHRDVDVRSVLGPENESDSLLFLRLALNCLHEHAEATLTRGAAPVAALWGSGSVDIERMQRNASWIVTRLEEPVAPRWR